MGLTPNDLLTVTLVVTLAVALGAAVYFRLLGWHTSRSPRLRLLTGTRSQHAAIVLAVRPLVRELIPGLEAAGLEIGSIALLPTLAGSAGEPLQAQVEQVNGTRSFIIRLAHMVGGTLRRPMPPSVSPSMAGVTAPAGSGTPAAIRSSLIAQSAATFQCS